MKSYLYLIGRTQTFLLGISVFMLMTLPGLLALYPDTFSGPVIDHLYTASHFALFFVMSVRPLADIFTDTRWIRPLVILRKGAGVFSASIIVSFILSKFIVDPSGFLGDFGTMAYWSFHNFALFTHLADISAVLLLITSNNLSKRLLGKNWKRIQRLSYVYFYGSTIYVLFIYSDPVALFYLIVVTFLTIMAFGMNRSRKHVAVTAST